MQSSSGLGTLTQIPVYTTGNQKSPCCIQDATRGTAIIVTQDGDPYFQAYFDLVPDQPRGGRGHMHPTKAERITILEGRVVYLFGTMLTDGTITNVQTMEITGPANIDIPARTVHMLYPLTPGRAIEYSGTPHTEAMDPNGTIRLDFGEELIQDTVSKARGEIPLFS